MVWQLVRTWTFSQTITSVTFDNLGIYNDIHFLFRNVSTTFSGGIRQLQVSVNNGATFLQAFDSYVLIQSNTGELTSTSIALHQYTSSGARSGNIEINGLNLEGPPKTAQIMNRTEIRSVIIPTSNIINAVLFFDGSGAAFASGNIWIYAR